MRFGVMLNSKMVPGGLLLQHLLSWSLGEP